MSVVREYRGVVVNGESGWSVEKREDVKVEVKMKTGWK